MTCEDPRFEELTRSECLDLVGSVAVGRVIYTDHALPAVRPVVLLLQEDAVVFPVSSSSRLAAAAPGSVVAVAVDSFAPDLRAGWSVIVTGLAAQVALGDGTAPLPAWMPELGDCLLSVPLTLVSGRRIMPAEPSRSAAYRRTHAAGQ